MGWSLEQAYDAYPRLEEEFSAALDESLHPRGPDLLYDLVAGLGLPPGAVALDVGCGEGGQALALHERFGFRVTGIDPVPRHLELARAAAGLAVDERVDIGTEWGEWAEERRHHVSRKLLHAARLRRDPARYVDRFGQDAYDMMLGDSLWHVYALLGKLTRRAYLLSAR